MKDNDKVGAEANPEHPDEMSVVNIPSSTRNAAIVGKLHQKASNYKL